MKDVHGYPGVGGFRDILVIFDRATEMLEATAVKSMDDMNTYRALKHWIGDKPERTVQRIYSDNHKSIINACEELRINHELSTPGVHQTNAVIENKNKLVENGIRCALITAGLPSCWWPLAAPCWCFLHNVEEPDGAPSHYFRRHNEKFTGQMFPFGCGVWYIPSPTRQESVRSKADPRLKFGIFMGYRLAPGGKWNGEYLVIDIARFTDIPLHYNTKPDLFPRMIPEITKTIDHAEKGQTNKLSMGSKEDTRAYSSLSKKATRSITPHWKVQLTRNMRIAKQKRGREQEDDKIVAKLIQKGFILRHLETIADEANAATSLPPDPVPTVQCTGCTASCPQSDKVLWEMWHKAPRATTTTNCRQCRCCRQTTKCFPQK